MSKRARTVARQAPEDTEQVETSCGFGPMFDDADYQTHLVDKGWVVIPTLLGADRQKLARVKNAFDQHFLDSPELSNPQPKDPKYQNVLGGFAALGNPSSFHAKQIRMLREKCQAAVLDSDALPIEGRRLEQCFDRVLRRIPGETIDAESWHRDEAKNALTGDDIFGGWINLDSEPQYFSCAPGTHKDVGTNNNGFAKISDPEDKAHFRDVANACGPVVIPSGHILIFYERLVHQVIRSKATHIMQRLFLGWRVTTAHEPLFGTKTTKMWIDTQMPAQIKSGQKTAVYPTAYYNFTRHFPTLTAFSKVAFVPQCLYQHTVKSGVEAGTVWTRVDRYMKGLVHYGLPLHAPYDRHEINVLMPLRSWMLYTFDSPTVRVAFCTVPTGTWQTYRNHTFAVDAQGHPTRRPRPARTNCAQPLTL